jgi:ADP-ribose pyrophosphatase YjhB (NUDIX family)
MDPQWLTWAKRLQALAQDGLTYTKDHYDVERYEQLRTITAEILATYAEADLAHVRGLLAHEQGPATPKVDVRGAAFHDGKLLLVKEPSDGAWSLPGGWADVGESPAQAIVREIREESGYETRVVKLAALYDRDKHPHPPYLYPVYKVFFICELARPSPSIEAETDAEFFAAGALPQLSLTRVLPGQIARLFEHYHDPILPTDFD